MTTANVAQTLNESIAVNPGVPARVAQAIQESIAINPGVPARASQVYMEAVITRTANVAQVMLEVIVLNTIAPFLTWDGKRIDGTTAG